MYVSYVRDYNKNDNSMMNDIRLIIFDVEKVNEILDNEVYKMSGIEKVILLRSIMGTFLLSNKYDVNINMLLRNTNKFAINNNVFVNYIGKKIDIFSYYKFMNPIESNTYVNDKDMTKYDVESIVKGTKYFITSFSINGPSMSIKQGEFAKGGIGNDIVNIIYNEMLGGSCFGAVGVGINIEDNTVYNASGYVIKDYKNSLENKYELKNISDNTFPSIDIKNKDDFFNLFDKYLNHGDTQDVMETSDINLNIVET